MDFGDLVEAIMDRPGPTRLVAIDGPGGAGKSTFAFQLARAAGGAPVIRTDDFASADNPINWWPRMLTEVIEPLTRGETAHYQRYDWPSEFLAESHTVEPSPIVIIEGVSAGRSEWAALLSFLIWIDTPPNERLRRVIERDGSEALEDASEWMADEDDHFERDPTKQRANVVIDGTASHTKSRDVVAQLHDVVAAVIIRNNKVLLCHRHPTREWYPNVWDLPGGHVNPGEQRLDALARELREELGIEINVAHSVSVLRNSPKPDLEIEVWAVTSWRGEIVNAEPTEHDKIGWFGQAELEQLNLADPGVALACSRALHVVSRTYDPMEEPDRGGRNPWEGR